MSNFLFTHFLTIKNVYYIYIFLEKLRPVLVYIHGGAFMFGSGSACWYGPEFWMIHDIIVVTFNYRLGPLGKPIPEHLSLDNLLSLLPFSILPFNLLSFFILPFALLSFSLLTFSLLPFSLLPFTIFSFSLMSFSL